MIGDRPGDRRRILVVAVEKAPAAELRQRLRELGGRAPTEVKVVAPASKLTPLQWLANDEDEARERADGVAHDVAEAAGAEAERASAEAGDVDPLQATEDALREFDADELVVVLPDEQGASWLERGHPDDAFERFGLPVTYVGSR